jgi:8-oxo-dGTP pyrophosphatase MutT (NUDIX family)
MTGPASPVPGTPRAAAASWLDRFPVLHPPVSTAGAAVTLVLRDGLSDVETLVIQRASNPEDPASGDVALPGGRVDERDGSLAATALRELREEVGLGSSDLAGPLRFVGAVAAPRFRLHVGVFAAALAETGGPPTIGSPEEVAHVFWLPAGALAESRRIDRAWDGGTRRVFASVHEGHVVWGFTRRVLRDFFALPPEDAPDGPVYAPPPGGAPPQGTADGP